MTQKTGRKAAAERTRFMRNPGTLSRLSGRDLAGRDAHLLRLGADPPVAPIPLLVVDDGLQELPPAEVGPERFRDPDLGVGDLPEKEVADAQLPGRADQQIRIGLAGGVEEGRELRLVHRRARAAAPGAG